MASVGHSGAMQPEDPDQAPNPGPDLVVLFGYLPLYPVIPFFILYRRCRGRQATRREFPARDRR